MGFYEDDRIRSKNAKYNCAYVEYNKLVGQGYTDHDITFLCTKKIEASNDDIRNEIYSSVLKIVGRFYEKGNNN